MATKVLELDLAEGIADLGGLDGYAHAMVLWRWRGRVLGRAEMEVREGRIAAASVWRAALRTLDPATIGAAIADGTDREPAAMPSPDPQSATVVVCTRDRPGDLRSCLESLARTVPPGTEILVVDNASSEASTRAVAEGFEVRYALEPCPGLNRARSRGVETASGDIVVFVDDDVVAGVDWLPPLLAPFADPDVACVTGLVMPFELETESQEAFERWSGFARRGFRRRTFTLRTVSAFAAGQVGAGACMALRRGDAARLGLFEADMDAGSPTRSGGDTFAFYRLLRVGLRLVYEPQSIVWHRHRRDEAATRDCLQGYGTGTYAFFLRALLVEREISAAGAAFLWLYKHHLRQLWRGLRGKPDAQPLAFTSAELRGVLAAPAAHLASRRLERARRHAAPSPAHARP